MMLSVDDETREDLERLAQLLRKPAATVAAELLSDLRPYMRSLALRLEGILEPDDDDEPKPKPKARRKGRA